MKKYGSNRQTGIR